MSFDFNRIHDYSETDPSEGLDLFEGLSQILSDINKVLICFLILPLRFQMMKRKTVPMTQHKSVPMIVRIPLTATV